MNFNKIYLVLALVCTQITFAQEGLPIYSDYFADNYYLLHPSMAGAAAHNQVRLTARQQWFDDNGAPNLQTASVNARVGRNSGLGGIFYNDSNGFHSQTGGYLTFAYHILLSRNEVDLNQLSFGISGGLTQSQLDETSFPLVGDDFDPLISGIIQQGSYFNFDLGMSYNFLNFSGHATIKNLLFVDRPLAITNPNSPLNPNDPTVTPEGLIFEPNNLRAYILSASYAISGPRGRKYRSNWVFEPGFLFHWQEAFGQQFIDVNFKTYRNIDDFGSLWAGLSYRRSFDGAQFLDGASSESQKLQYVTPVLGVNYRDFMFAYTYSYLAGQINFTGGGFHQITLGFDFLAGRKEPYDCNCPAIN